MKLSKEAMADYDKAIELDPGYGSSYFNRGIARQHLGDKKGACEDFNKALALGYENAITKVGDCQ